LRFFAAIDSLSLGKMISHEEARRDTKMVSILRFFAAIDSLSLGKMISREEEQKTRKQAP
jgi:hypothetical protein